MIEKMRVDLELDDEDIPVLVSQAVLHGYKKPNERLRWNGDQHKDAIRYLVKKLLNDKLRPG